MGPGQRLKGDSSPRYRKAPHLSVARVASVEAPSSKMKISDRLRAMDQHEATSVPNWFMQGTSGRLY